MAIRKSRGRPAGISNRARSTPVVRAGAYVPGANIPRRRRRSDGDRGAAEGPGTGPNNISAISNLTFAYLDSGDLEKTRTLLEDRRSLFSKNYLWRQLWALLLAVEGHRDEALQTMDQDTLKFAAAAFPSTIGVAEFYAVIGDASKAIEWLERTVRNGDERTAWFRRSPRLEHVRADPRFQQIIDSVESRRDKSQR